jgi:predicted Rossmann fold nucleotide-binding protein DprA/Smf involved in DNA uptake
MDETEKTIFDLLSKENELNIDAICRTLGLPVYKLSSLLLQMEFKGLVKCYPGTQLFLLNILSIRVFNSKVISSTAIGW